MLCLIPCFAAQPAQFPTGKHAESLPDVTTLERYRPTLSTKIYDINGELIDEFYIERRTFVPLANIPQYLRNAIIAIEDDDFYSHWGISLKGMMRAAVRDVCSMRLAEGGSTITQQLAKTAFLTQEKTISRKIKELRLALQLEQKYSKNEILEMYLNQIYFGHGVYGVDLAARLYFNKPIERLTLNECALLAALPKAPTFYSPFRNPKACLARRNLVLERMKEKKYITNDEAKKAAALPLSLSPKGPNMTSASYFVEYIRQQLEPRYGDLLYKGGLKIYTTLDVSMQTVAVKYMGEYLSQFDVMKASEALTQKGATVQPKRRVEGALVALDPKTGQIRAMVGGRDFRVSQFNRVTQARRQPGSAFKPIIYTAALDLGFTALSRLEDTPRVYYNNGRDWQLMGKTTDFCDIEPTLKASLDFKDPMQVWAPQNYDCTYSGTLVLRESLERSINLSTIWLLEQITPAVAVDYAKKMGVTSTVDPYLAMALGTFVVTPLEITRAYATLANRGIKTTPYSVIKVYDNDGKLLEEHFPVEEAVLSPQTAYLVTTILKGVIEHGTGQSVRYRFRRPAAGKTGTTNDFTDAWFIGYTPELVTSVWVGYDDHKPLGKRMSGSVMACPLWADFMNAALARTPVSDFSVPDNIVFLPVDKQTKVPSTEFKNTYMEAFLKGTENTSLTPSTTDTFTLTTSSGTTSN